MTALIYYFDPRELDVFLCFTPSRGFSGQIPSFSDGSSLPHPLVKFISHTGCGGQLPTRSHLTRDWQRYSRIIWIGITSEFHLAHGECRHLVLLTRLNIDDCPMSHPEFHIAHGGRYSKLISPAVIAFY
jgi:hypothetical protein